MLEMLLSVLKTITELSWPQRLTGHLIYQYGTLQLTTGTCTFLLTLEHEAS
jgi:hypothetical protein